MNTNTPDPLEAKVDDLLETFFELIGYLTVEIVLNKTGKEAANKRESKIRGDAKQQLLDLFKEREAAARVEELEYLYEFSGSGTRAKTLLAHRINQLKSGEESRG